MGRSWFAARNVTWPFAKLEVGESELVLTCLGRRVFPKDAIQKLRRHNGIFFVGLRIEHSVDRIPAYVVFWTFGFAELHRELEQRGYTVSTG